MKKQTSVKLFLIQWFFLVITAISGFLIYKMLFPLYYDHLKNTQIHNAYLDIAELDLNCLDDYSIFRNYEQEGLSFVIADEDMDSVYTTGEDSEYLVYLNVERKLNEFSKSVQILNRDSRQKEVAKLRVILTQEDMDFYVVIKDSKYGGGITGKAEVSRYFLVVIFVLVFGIDSLFTLFLSGYLTKPVERIALITEKIANRDFTVKADENSKFQEVRHLAKSVNELSSMLQQSIGQIDESKDRQLRQNVRQERLEKMRKDFIANVTHELKTPLAVISSQAEMLEYVEGEDREYYLASIQEEVQKMSGLVSGLLDTTVMEHHMDNMIKKALNMKEVMEYIILKYDGLAKKRKVHIESFLAEDCIICGDRDYVEQAVDNYMMNAFDHTEMGGSIRVTLRKSQRDIRLGVYNTGKQIPVEELVHIWNGFYSKNRKENGELSHAGLGLYIVQSVVTMHNGKYGVENLPEGVEFWFTIPQAGESKANDTPINV